MTDQTTAAKPRPAKGAAPFDNDEVFFSRTDPRGVIAAFNNVFCRVADYPAVDLLGAPHKIIRHPDMPRGVFWLMWESLKAGRPIGAYVKNQARDGLHYWVYAVATPIEGGYLSVRMKPGSSVLEVIEREYAALRAREEGEGLSPEASAGALIERLRALGYDSYGTFQARALGGEVAHLDKVLGAPEDRRLAGMTGLIRSVGEMRVAQRDLSAHFASIRSIPSNMRIMASRIEASGGPISAISENYKLMSGEVIAQLERFAGKAGIRKLHDSYTEDDGLFVLGASRLMGYAVGQFKGEETMVSGVDFTQEMGKLSALSAQYADSANRALQNVTRQAAVMARSAADLRRMVAGLDSIRVMCRVESGRLSNHYDGLDSIIDSLDTFHHQIDQQLEALGQTAEKIRLDADNVLKVWRAQALEHA